MEFWPIIYSHCFLISSFKTLGFWPYFYKHWNYDLMIPKNGILAPFFINTGILTLSFQTSEFLYCPSKHWNSGPIFYTLHFDFILRNIGILDLSFKPLEFWPSIDTHWNCEVIPPNIAILALYLFKLKFSSYPSKRWNSDPIFIHIDLSLPMIGPICIKIENVILSFPTPDFWPYFNAHWFSYLFLPNNGILALFL